MDDFDAAEEWLDSWATGVDARAAAAVELSRRVSGLTGSARGRDDRITVEVGPSGQLTHLVLKDHPELAKEITALVARAQADLSSKVAEQVHETVGEDSPTGRAVLHSFSSRFPSPDPPGNEH